MLTRSRPRGRHHTNSTAICDWAMRRPGARLHLLQRYTTPYWTVLARASAGFAADGDAGGGGGEGGEAAWAGAVEARASSGAVVVAPLVSRHIDFLESMAAAGTLPLPQAQLRLALSRVVLLLGSAPVGPTTVERLQRLAGTLPTVRFGSTETCLQAKGVSALTSARSRRDLRRFASR